MLSIFEEDVGLHILSLIDLETLKYLYITFPCFKKILSDKRVLEYIRQTNRIIPTVNSFPQYHVYYTIKYGDYSNSPFNVKFVLDMIVENDDVEALINQVNVSHNSYSQIFELAVNKNKHNITNYLISLAKTKDCPYYFKIFLDAYNGNITAVNISWQRYDVINGLLFNKRYDEALKYELTMHLNDSRYIVKTYCRYIFQYNYNDCMKLLEKCINIPRFEQYRKYTYERCCNRFAYLNRVDDIKRMLSEQLITIDDMKQIAINCRWFEYDMCQEIWELIDYDLPQMEDGCLTMLMYDTHHLNTNIYCYSGSAIQLLKGLHKRDINFKVSKVVLEEASRSKDLLAVAYISKNNLCN